MILTRITRSIVEQNWATILLELVVVIVGIFLGLQATEWHEDRQARAEGHYYLDLLRRQLNSEILLREKDLADMADRIDRISNTYKLLFADDWSDDEYAQFKSDHRSVYQAAEESMRPSALRQLLDGGKIELVRSRAMQETLFDLDRAYEEAIRQSEVSNRLYFEAATVLAMEIPYGTREDIGAIRAEPSVLLQSDKIKWVVRSMLLMNRIQLNVLKDLQDSRRSARDELETYLLSQASFDASHLE
jgi:hypothetical protein